MTKDGERAAAELYREAQAHALLRLYRRSEGHEAESLERFTEWRQQDHLPGRINPTGADIEAVEREHPDLAMRACRSNPFLSVEN